MDPNTCLEMCRKLAKRALQGEEVDVEELAEAFQNLDNWLSEGGFLPSEWRRDDTARLERTSIPLRPED